MAKPFTTRLSQSIHDSQVHKQHMAERKCFFCCDVMPSHSYVYFDGRVGGCTVSRDLTHIVYHHPTGGDYPKKSLDDLQQTLGKKGTNSIAARQTIDKIKKWIAS